MPTRDRLAHKTRQGATSVVKMVWLGGLFAESGHMTRILSHKFENKSALLTKCCHASQLYILVKSHAFKKYSLRKAQREMGWGRDRKR
jgi:hypothetical protein